MGKIVYVNIVGKSYPMSFSLGASKKIIEKYGSAEKMKVQLKKSDDVKKIDMISEVLELLIAQGCAYKNYFEKDIPAPKNAPVIEGKWVPISKEILEIAVGVNDMEDLAEKIEECVSFGSKKEYEAKATGKNAKATQE